MKKTHLHSEQFDGHLHAVCCTIKNEDKAKIVGGGISLKILHMISAAGNVQKKIGLTEESRDDHFYKS